MGDDVRLNQQSQDHASRVQNKTKKLLAVQIFALEDPTIAKLRHEIKTKHAYKWCASNHNFTSMNNFKLDIYH